MKEKYIDGDEEGEEEEEEVKVKVEEEEDKQWDNKQEEENSEVLEPRQKFEISKLNLRQIILFMS